MKKFYSLFIAIVALLSVQVANAQCTGTISYSGTDPSFTFTSTNPTGSFMNHTWDFGDGNYAYTQNPSHTYTTNGLYTVISYYSDSLNICSDIDTIQISVMNATPNCSAAFNIATSASPTFTFTPTVTLFLLLTITVTHGISVMEQWVLQIQWPEYHIHIQLMEHTV